MDKPIKLIAVLGGGFKKDAGGWRTTGYGDDGDKFGVQGDRLRVDAAYCLYKNFSRKDADILFLSSGGRGQLKDIPDSPSVASVIKNELLELGIPERKIFTEENSDNTYQQLQRLIPILQKHSPENCLILSNGWHLLRIRAMIEYGPGLDFLKEKLMSGSITLVSAEQVLIDSDPLRWKEMISVAFGTPAMRERIKKEEQGVSQIRSGLYKWQ